MNGWLLTKGPDKIPNAIGVVNGWLLGAMAMHGADTFNLIDFALTGPDSFTITFPDKLRLRVTVAEAPPEEKPNA